MRALRRWLAKQIERWSRLAGPSHQDYALPSDTRQTDAE